MSDETSKATKPREIVPAPTSAGSRVDENARAQRGRRLPFDPHDFTIKEKLPAKLQEVSDVATLNALQAFDRRVQAAAHYERRIKELQEAEPTAEEA